MVVKCACIYHNDAHNEKCLYAGTTLVSNMRRDGNQK